MTGDTTFGMEPDRLAALEREATQWFAERIEPQPSGSQWLGLDTSQMAIDFFWWMIQRNSIGHDQWIEAWLDRKLQSMDGVKKMRLSEEFHGYECWSVQPKGPWVPSSRALPKESREELEMEPGDWVFMPFQSYGEALDYLLYAFGSVTSAGRFLGLMGTVILDDEGVPLSEDNAFQWLPTRMEEPYGPGTLRASVADVKVWG